LRFKSLFTVLVLAAILDSKASAIFLS